MGMISYAQNGEDVLLNRVFPEGEGFYIDIGANDPVELSVTKHFYDRGWRGINVEPQPAAFARVADGRPRDINLNAGISDQRGVLVFFDVVKATGWSTFSAAQAENLRAQGLEVRERRIPVATLAEVCETHVRGPIDFLKVDAESHETEVLAGADWSRWRPRVVVVESTGWVHWEPGLLASGYQFALFDGINRFYLRDEDRNLQPRFATMANFQDDYVAHAHAQEVARLKKRLEAAESLLHDLNPLSRKLHNFLRRNPRIRSMIDGRSRRVG